METKCLQTLTGKFSKESEFALIRFADAVNKTPTLNCDMNQYEIWKCYAEENDLSETSLEKSEIIEFVKSDKLQKSVDFDNKSIIIAEEIDHQQLTPKDVTAFLKKQFKSVDYIPLELFNTVLRYPSEAVQKIFTSLSGVLNSEQILVFGESIDYHLENDLLMDYFCRCLLVQMTTVFTEDLEVLFVKLCTKSPSRILTHIVSIIEINDKVDILLLYFTGMETTLQERLLCELLRTHTSFTGKYVSVSECLVNKDMKYNILQKLLEIMANNVEQYVTDKEYGKLLFKVVKYLGENYIHLENILTHILKNHKSIWKAKLQKSLTSIEFRDV